MLLPRFSGDFLSLFRWHNDDTISVTNDNITGVYDNTTTGNGHIDFTRSIFEGTFRHDATSINGHIQFFQISFIAYGAINDDPSNTQRLAFRHHDIATKGIGDITIAINDDNVAWLSHCDGFMQ